MRLYFNCLGVRLGVVECLICIVFGISVALIVNI